MAPLPDLPDDQRKLLERWLARFDSAERGVQKPFRTESERRYKDYLIFRSLKDHGRGGAGRDELAAEADDAWGSDLAIPYAFWTIETIVARALSNRPKMLLEPWDKAAVENTENMSRIIDAQQEQMGYLMTCQATMKTALLYGLGAQKGGWRNESRKSYVLTRGISQEWAAEPCTREFDDAWVEDVDPLGGLIWDPYAEDVDGADWIIHRTWRSKRYIMSKIREGQKAVAQAGPMDGTGQMRGWFLAAHLTEEDVNMLASPDKWSEVMKERMEARGLRAGGSDESRPHEVWECHNGDRVVTILDRSLPVADSANNEWHGDMPFHIYRPSVLPHEFVGIGAIEPAKDLFYEMNLTRSQRADLASLALTPAYAYRDGSIDPSILQFRPGALIPTLGDPKDIMQRIQLGDVPQSGYMEEDRIRADIERATGLGDTLLGAAATGGGTATEAQLQLSSANVRIQNMTFRFEQEILKPVAQHLIEMNQQHILEERGYSVPTPAPGSPDRRWSWFPVGPEMLAGAMVARGMGGSEAKNVPQERNDAQQAMTLFGQDSNVDHRRLIVWAAEKLDIPHPETILAPQEQTIPAAALPAFAQALAQATGGHVSPDEVMGVFQEVLQGGQEQASAPPDAMSQQPQEQPQA